MKYLTQSSSGQKHQSSEMHTQPIVVFPSIYLLPIPKCALEWCKLADVCNTASTLTKHYNKKRREFTPNQIVRDFCLFSYDKGFDSTRYLFPYSFGSSLEHIERGDNSMDIDLQNATGRRKNAGRARGFRKLAGRSVEIAELGKVQ